MTCNPFHHLASLEPTKPGITPSSHNRTCSQICSEKARDLESIQVLNLHSQPNYGSNYLSTDTMTAVTCKALPSAMHKGEHRSPGETLNNQMQCDHQIKCNVISLCNQSMQALLSPSFVVHRPLLVLSGHELIHGVFPPGLILQVRWVVAI